MTYKRPVLKTSSLSFVAEDEKRIYDIHRVMQTLYTSCFYTLHEQAVKNYYLMKLYCECEDTINEVRDKVDSIVKR